MPTFPSWRPGCSEGSRVHGVLICRVAFRESCLGPLSWDFESLTLSVSYRQMEAGKKKAPRMNAHVEMIKGQSLTSAELSYLGLEVGERAMHPLHMWNISSPWCCLASPLSMTGTRGSGEGTVILVSLRMLRSPLSCCSWWLLRPTASVRP